eukprot:9425831-Pyramimonas_sp.AAC.1
MKLPRSFTWGRTPRVHPSDKTVVDKTCVSFSPRCSPAEKGFRHSDQDAGPGPSGEGSDGGGAPHALYSRDEQHFSSRGEKSHRQVSSSSLRRLYTLFIVRTQV